MKKLVLFLLGLSLSASVIAQTSQEQAIEYDKRTVQGVSIMVPSYSVDLVKAALQQRLEKGATLKGSNSKGWRIYLAQQFSEIGSMNFDIYTQVTTVGKKNTQSTIIYFLVSKGNENFVTSTTDPEIIENVKKFLNGFVTYLREYDINQKILEQNNLISKLQKEQSNMEADRDKMKSQIVDLEKKVSAKETDINNKANEIQKAKDLLNSLQSSLR